MAVHDASHGSARAYWQPTMGCLLDAYEDWGCADLLSPDQAHWQ